MNNTIFTIFHITRKLVNMGTTPIKYLSFTCQFYEYITNNSYSYSILIVTLMKFS